MRIIAGEHRGRRLLPPEGKDTRPMLDRVREALFSTLGEVVPGARVLDLFAGTGSLGLEALSRGAERVHFVERDPRALRILNRNIETLRVADDAEVVRGDALERRAWGPSGSPGEGADMPAVDIVFLDPPYPMLRDARSRSALLEALRDLHDHALATGGVIVLHAHPRDMRQDALPDYGRVDRREYGNSVLVYVWKPPASSEVDDGAPPERVEPAEPGA